MSTSVDRALDRLKEQVRTGRYIEGREGIARLLRGRLTRAQRLRLGYYANCCPGMALKAARILYALVRPDGGGKLQGSAQERIEYATALTSLGAYAQAIAIMRSARPDESRFAGLLSFAYNKLWDWTTPVPFLESALRRRDLTENERMRARQQLALCLLHGRDDVQGARKLAREVIELTGPSHFASAHWEGLQILAQTYYLEKDWAGARGALDRLAAFEFGAPEWYALIIRKWRDLIDLHEPRKAREALRDLARTRTAMLEAENWEQVRSCDFYQAIVTKDRQLMSRVYFGSPYPALRAKLLRAFGMSEAELPPTYDFPVGPQAHGGGVLHVIDGRNDFGRARLIPGSVAQRLLAALTADFYVPPNNVHLHELIYPGEYLNPVTGLDRVEKAIRALREWLKTNRIPLDLEKRHGRVRLASRAGVTLEVEKEPAWLEPGAGLDPKTKQLLVELRGRFSGAPFRARDVESFSGLSRPTVMTLLNPALEAGLLTKSGNGPGTRYRFRAG